MVRVAYSYVMIYNTSALISPWNCSVRLCVYTENAIHIYKVFIFRFSDDISPIYNNILYI